MRTRVVCLVGPTASGKTTAAFGLAAHLPIDIVSADSRQVYRQLDIGTAKPTAEERRGVPHHCLDLVDPTDVFDAAQFRTAAAAAIDDITARGRIPLVVGGTGLWVRALLHGLCPAPPRVPALRAELEALRVREGAAALHARLATVDPRAAARLHPNDAMRVIRAIEVAETSGAPLSTWQAAHAFAEAPFDTLVLGFTADAAVLTHRIADRLDSMLARGWVDEVRGLLARGIPDDAPGWRTLGYRELRSVVWGEHTQAAATDAILRATRRFAARQRMWFRREPGVEWLPHDTTVPALIDRITAFLTRPATAAPPHP
jgi:tRNA dimethylallyltransferase